MIRRLKKLGTKPEILLDLYNKHTRSILEYAAPACGPMLSDENIYEIERVKKCAYSVIFGPNSYQKSLQRTKNLTLKQRRVIFANKFAVKCADSPTLSRWFVKKYPNYIYQAP